MRIQKLGLLGLFAFSLASAAGRLSREEFKALPQEERLAYLEENKDMKIKYLHASTRLIGAEALPKVKAFFDQAAKDEASLWSDTLLEGEVTLTSGKIRISDIEVLYMLPRPWIVYGYRATISARALEAGNRGTVSITHVYDFDFERVDENVAQFYED
jgi:hypothetical protein